jgi:hypothetical protein
MLKGFGSHFRHNVVAYLALFFALAGTAVAAKPLLTGADIQDDSLTGADVLESSLGKVPSAASADSAGSAANADKLDGKGASDFVQGSGKLSSLDVAIRAQSNQNQSQLLTVVPGGRIDALCGSQESHAAALQLTSARGMKLWQDTPEGPFKYTPSLDTETVGGFAGQVIWHGSSDEGSFTATAFYNDECHFAVDLIVR